MLEIIYRENGLNDDFFIGKVSKNGYGKRIRGVRVLVKGSMADFFGYEGAKTSLREHFGISLLVEGYEEGTFTIPQLDLNSYTSNKLSEEEYSKILEIVKDR